MEGFELQARNNPLSYSALEGVNRSSAGRLGKTHAHAPISDLRGLFKIGAKTSPPSHHVQFLVMLHPTSLPLHKTGFLGHI
eukprot:3268092-Amphidinium_carterae.1